MTKEQYIAGVINSITTKYPELRRKSKGPTFALQYMGTAHTLHKRTGFPKDQAKQIYDAFHELYKVSGEFNAKNKEFKSLNYSIIQDPPVEWKNYDVVLGEEYFVNNTKISKILKHGKKQLIKNPFVFLSKKK